MPKYRIKHITRYTYPSTVIDSANQVMLFPVDDAQQEVKKHELIITHQPSVEIYTDYFGNKVGIFSVIRPHIQLTIESIIEVIILETQLPGTDTAAETQWDNLAMIREQFPYMDFMFRETSDAESEITAVALSKMGDTLSPFSVAELLSSFVYDNFEYKKGITSVETKVDENRELTSGVFQVFSLGLSVNLLV